MITIIVCNPNKNKQESSQPGPDVKASPSADVAGPNTDQKKSTYHPISLIYTLFIIPLIDFVIDKKIPTLIL